MELLTILEGDAVTQLRTLETGSVHCCVTSPPFWGLRDYGTNGQLGLEKTPEEYVRKMVEVFREVRRVLRKDGTLWLNLGDSYARDPGKGDRADYLGLHKNIEDSGCHHASQARTLGSLKPKDLCGIPWRVAFALQADGWWLRSDIIWAKPNPMPESVTDRPTKSHEYLFLLTKSANYFYDAEAIKEPQEQSSIERARYSIGFFPKQDTADHSKVNYVNRNTIEKTRMDTLNGSGRNKRSVWTVATAPYPEAHFATYPPDLIKPCILAGSRVGDTILDPFAGSGTTGMVALELGRKTLLIELNPKYCDLIRQRCYVTPGLALA